MKPYKTLLPLFASLCLAGSAIGQLSVPSTFNFGTDTGRTLTSADFNVSATTADATVSNQATSLRVNATTNTFYDAFFLAEFSGLGGTNTNNFTFSMDTTLEDYSTGNNRRFGIHLFAGANNDTNTGISAQLISTGTSSSNIQFRTGVNGLAFGTVSFGEGLAAGKSYSFTVSGTYLSATELLLNFNVVSGSTNVSTSATVDPNDYTGTFFGGSGRIRGLITVPDVTTVDFHNFSVIPEPGVYALLAGVLAFGVIIIRRRRS